MDKNVLTSIQLETIEKFQALFSHFQKHAEGALPPGVLRCNEDGPWRLMRDFYIDMLNESMRKSINKYKATQQQAFRDEADKKK